jgi:hypothetical protein
MYAFMYTFTYTIPVIFRFFGMRISLNSILADLGISLEPVLTDIRVTGLGISSGGFVYSVRSKEVPNGSPVPIGAIYMCIYIHIYIHIYLYIYT